MEEPQHCFCDKKTIMHPIRSLGSLVCILLAHAPTLNPHLKLPLNKSLIKLHVTLRGEQSLVDIYTLNASVVAGTPNVNLGVLWYQIGGLGGRRINDVIKMHLVKVDLGLCFGKVEKMAANVGELDGLMGQLPFTVLLWFDGSTKSSAKNLVSETYPCETDVGAMCPDVCHAISH